MRSIILALFTTLPTVAIALGNCKKRSEAR